MFKKLLTFSTAVAGMAANIGISSAADLLPPPPPPPAPMVTEIRQSVYDWTSVYLGVVGGGNCLVSGYTVIGNPDPEMNGCGLHGGAVLGYNYQFGSGLVGIEADVTHGTRTGSNTAPAQDVFYNIGWRGSLRARLGWLATDQTLFYGTAGVSFMRGTLSAITGAGPRSTTMNHLGYVVGGGMEHAFTNNWHARLEYLFASYNSQVYSLCATCNVAVIPSQVHTARVGLTYNFSVGSW